MLTRRELLNRVLGTVTAAIIAPHVNLEDQTFHFWNQPPLLGKKIWKIVFPDGTVFKFSGIVTSEDRTVDGISVCVRPTGPMEIYQALPESSSTRLVLPSGEGMNISEITPPTIETVAVQTHMDALEEFIPAGIRRRGPITIKGKWDTK